MVTKDKNGTDSCFEKRKDVSVAQDGILDKKLSEKEVQNRIDSMSEEELLALKRFLFEERIRVIQEKDEQKAVYEKFLKERLVFQEEMKALNHKVLAERKRLKEENSFFDKKMQILQNGFLQLDLDRKKLEREKKQYENQKKYSDSYTSSSYSSYKGNAPEFFKGVNNILGLKKRYRDLLKIFHPDNLCGDSETVLEINKQYDAMRKRMGER
jgi:hypothetical protein